MDPQVIPELVRELWEAPISHLKRVAHTYGPCNPVGDGDAKTGTPSTYRPVGSTCPETCVFLGHGCYAEAGNVNLHQTRASDTVTASVISAAVGMTWALRVGKVCRLHISGDFMRQGRIDHQYIAQLGIVCDSLRHVIRGKQARTLAWSYTHIPQPTFAPYARYLSGKGIHVRFSDYMGTNGALVCDFDALPALRSDNEVKYVKCPAQMPQKLTCGECRLCWELPSHTVVFHPHGTTSKRARSAALRILP